MRRQRFSNEVFVNWQQFPTIDVIENPLRLDVKPIDVFHINGISGTITDLMCDGRVINLKRWSWSHSFVPRHFTSKCSDHEHQRFTWNLPAKENLHSFVQRLQSFDFGGLSFSCFYFRCVFRVVHDNVIYLNFVIVSLNDVTNQTLVKSSNSILLHFVNLSQWRIIIFIFFFLLFPNGSSQHGWVLKIQIVVQSEVNKSKHSGIKFNKNWHQLEVDSLWMFVWKGMRYNPGYGLSHNFGLVIVSFDGDKYLPQRFGFNHVVHELDAQSSTQCNLFHRSPRVLWKGRI